MESEQRILVTTMSAITLDYPLSSLPGLPVREGQSFQGYVRDGKLHVTVPVVTSVPVAVDDNISAAERFVENWSGKGKLLPAQEIESDPRLAQLTSKHLR